MRNFINQQRNAIEISMRHHLIPVRRAIINKSTSTVRMWRKGSPCALLVGMQTGAATVENSIEVPQKIKNGTAVGPSDSTSGDLSKETQNTNSKEHMYPSVHCNIIYNRQAMEVTQCPSIEEWIKKLWYKYI